MTDIKQKATINFGLIPLELMENLLVNLLIIIYPFLFFLIYLTIHKLSIILVGF